MRVTANRVASVSARLPEAKESRRVATVSSPSPFGQNEWLVEEMYRKFREDPSSVDPSWHEFLVDYSPEPTTETQSTGGNGRPADGWARSRTAPPEPAPAPAPKTAESNGTAAPAKAPKAGNRKPDKAPEKARRRPLRRPPRPRREGDELQVLRGGRRRRREEHVGVAGGADGDERARDPGQADDRQPDRHQQPSQAHARRQDHLHPPDRLRAGAGGQEVPEHEPPLRRGGRQAERGHPRAHQPRARDRPAGQGRQSPAGGRRDQALRDNVFRPVHRGLRGHRAARPGRQADRRGFLRRDDFADQSRHHRHRALGAAADAWPGRDHRGGRDGIPGRVPGRQRGTHHRPGYRQAGHLHLHLRPPHHPGCGVGRLPAHRPPTVARRRVLRRDLPRAGHPV